MVAWRNLAILVGALTFVRPAVAQTYLLQEMVKPGDCFRLRLTMQLAGEWQVQREDKTTPIPVSAKAAFEFPERVLQLGAAGLPSKTARQYRTAQVTITTGKTDSERTLRLERRLMVAQYSKDQLVNYCPEGPLTRDELETIEHFDTLALVGVLPGQAVATSATWKLSNPVVQALCSFDGLIGHELSGKLESVKDDVAHITVTGTASGISVGAMEKLTIQATGSFDLKEQRLVALEWKQKDVRDQGPASPAATIESTWKIERALLEEEPKALCDAALVKVPDGDAPPESALQLSHRDPKRRYQLVYDRDWQVTSQTDDHLILRLIDRGDWVAQATITPWAKVEPGKHVSADDFKEAMADTPGWEADEVREDGEVPSEKGNWIYRLSALGEIDGVKVLQSFYLVAGGNGDQVVVAVTLRPALAEKLGTRDLKLVDGVELPKKPTND
jgi:hypothetical protein